VGRLAGHCRNMPHESRADVRRDPFDKFRGVRMECMVVHAAHTQSAHGSIATGFEFGLEYAVVELAGLTLVSADIGRRTRRSWRVALIER